MSLYVEHLLYLFPYKINQSKKFDLDRQKKQNGGSNWRTDRVYVIPCMVNIAGNNLVIDAFRGSAYIRNLWIEQSLLMFHD